MLEETRKISAQTPLFKRLEEKFKEDEVSEMEKRKKHLQSLRDLRQPIKEGELDEHSKKFEELVKIKTEQRKENRLKQFQSSYDYSKYHTKFLDNILEQE